MRYDNARKVREINNGRREREAILRVELITVTDPTGKDLRYSISCNQMMKVIPFASLKTPFLRVRVILAMWDIYTEMPRAPDSKDGRFEGIC